MLKNLQIIMIYKGEKRGQEVPGPLKKVLGLLDFFSPGATGPRDLQNL